MFPVEDNTKEMPNDGSPHVSRRGLRPLRLRNWAPVPFEPAELDAVILTHAHLDHSGDVPLLVRNGYEGPIYATSGTCDLCAVLLPDSGHLQERGAEYANRRGFSKHKPARPLYTQEDANVALDRFEPVPYDHDLDERLGLRARFFPAGHRLGSSLVRVTTGGPEILFSGDLGRQGDDVMVDPAPVRQTDYLVIESTQGDRYHEDMDVEDCIADVVIRVAKRGGTIVIPSFAVGRAKAIMFHTQWLKAEKRVSDVPVFLDSPMAISASEIFCRHMREHRLTAEQCQATCHVATYVGHTEDSKALDGSAMPKDHHLGERYGDGRSSSASLEALGIRSEKRHPVRRLSGQWDAWRADSRRCKDGQNSRHDCVDSSRGRESSYAVRPRRRERDTRVAERVHGGSPTDRCDPR